MNDKPKDPRKVAAGRKGGLARTRRKILAVRLNGKKGGAPKKTNE